jgi:hypothetical protein
MVTAKKTPEGVSKECSLLELRIDMRAELGLFSVEQHRVNREVDLPGLEVVGQVCGHRHNRQIDSWRLPPKSSQQCRQHEHIEQVRRAVAEHETQEEIIRKSGLDWTIVRSPSFTDGPVTGNYAHAFDNDEASQPASIRSMSECVWSCAGLGAGCIAW